VAFVDVLSPTPADVLRTSDEPAILVPAFLSRGYHVNTDIPAAVAASAHPRVTVTDALGPSPQLARMVTDRLIESGWQSDDSVILAAAGTSDVCAQRDLHVMATWVSAIIGSRVTLAFAPRIDDAVAAVRARGARRVVVASYLLSDGLFQERLLDSGADVVTRPLGVHSAMPRLIVSRFRRAGVAGTAAA
jgi:sirohydrochlorin ferrochelatase